jgi:P27 family predicted phage terminase small subunit
LKKLARKKRSAPPAPSNLSAEAKTWWKSIHEENEISDQSGLLLLQTSLEAFDLMRQAQAVIREHGVTILDRWGQIRANPAVAAARDARAAMLSALRQLNLDIEPTTPK